MIPRTPRLSKPSKPATLGWASRAHSPSPREPEAVCHPGVDAIIRHQRDLAVLTQTRAMPRSFGTNHLSDWPGDQPSAQGQPEPRPQVSYFSGRCRFPGRSGHPGGSSGWCSLQSTAPSLITRAGVCHLFPQAVKRPPLCWCRGNSEKNLAQKLDSECSLR